VLRKGPLAATTSAHDTADVTFYAPDEAACLIRPGASMYQKGLLAPVADKEFGGNAGSCLWWSLTGLKPQDGLCAPH
jgi:hypothetical protein